MLSLKVKLTVLRVSYGFMIRLRRLGRLDISGPCYRCGRVNRHCQTLVGVRLLSR